MIVTSQDVKKELENENVWEKQREGIRNQIDTLRRDYNRSFDLSGMGVMSDLNKSVLGSKFSATSGISSLQGDLSKNILENYIAGNAQKTEIGASNLIQGNKSALSQSLKDTLSAAYKSATSGYRQNATSVQNSLANSISGYESSAANALSALENKKASTNSSLDSDLAKATTKIDELIETESKNYADFYNSMPEYVTWLYSKMEEDSTLFENEFFKQFLNEEGNLKSKAQITEMLFDNTTGKISDKGKEIFGRLLNDPALTMGGLSGFSYDEYIAGSNSKLSEWLNTQSYYNENSRNFDDALSRLGINLADYTYDKFQPTVTMPTEPTSTQNTTTNNYNSDDDVLAYDDEQAREDYLTWDEDNVKNLEFGDSGLANVAENIVNFVPEVAQDLINTGKYVWGLITGSNPG